MKKEHMFMVLLVAIVFAPAMFGVVLGSSIASSFGSEPLEYTQMDEPDSDTPVGIMMTALKNLDEPNTLKTSDKMCPNGDTLLSYAKEKNRILLKRELDALARHYDPDSKTVMNDLAYELNANTELALRKLIRVGYVNRINWPSIDYIGYTVVAPNFNEEQNINLYFKDQDRIFSISFTGVYIASGEKFLSAAYMEDDPKFHQVDGAGEGIKEFFKNIFK